MLSKFSHTVEMSRNTLINFTNNVEGPKVTKKKSQDEERK